MSKHENTKTACLVISIVLMTSGHVEAASVGKVIFASGKCFAENTRKERRKIRRASQLNAGDTIYTQNSSKAQIRFVDGAVISLAENTTFKVNEYEYGQEKNTSKLELIKGGLRAITGKITSKDDYEYKVKTPLASISAEDAYWSASLVPVSGSPRANLTEPWQYQQELPTMFAEAKLPSLVPEMPAPALYGAPGRDNLKTELYTAVWRGEVNGTTNTGQDFYMGPRQDTNFGKVGQDSNFVALLEQPDTVAVKTDRKSSQQLSARSERQQRGQVASGQASPSQQQSSPRQTRQRQALALPPITRIAAIGPIPKPLIDDLNDLPGGNSVVLPSPRDKLIGASEFGFVISTTPNSINFDAGLAKTIDRGTGDAAVGNAFTLLNVTKNVTKEDGTFTAINPGPSGGGTFNWDTDSEINLLYGTWENPTFITTADVSTLNEVYVAIVSPMENQSHGFSGRIFNTVDFYKATDNVTTVNTIALDLNYNHVANAVTINDFDFDFVINKDGGGTINYYNVPTLSRGPVPGTAFGFVNSSLSCSGCGTFNAILSAAVTGEVQSANNVDEVGVAGILTVDSQVNPADSAQIIFGLSQ